MLLSDYIKQLQDLLETNGDTEKLYQAIDEEGNGYNLIGFGPELMYLPPGETDYAPDSLIPYPSSPIELDSWLYEHGLEESDLETMKTVILL